MPSSWTQNFYHAIFSTKDRVPLITSDIEQRLHQFLGGILRDLNCSPIAINGMADHVHLLVRYPADLSHSDMLREVKSRSSKWVHETFVAHRAFAWQNGYGGFTVSKSALDKVRVYIERQKEHHQHFDFKTELMELLRRHGIECTEDDVFS